MPKHYADLAQREPRHRVVCDYIAGMTDHFLLRQCHELLGAACEPPSAEARARTSLSDSVSAGTPSTGGFLDICRQPTI